MNTIIRFAILAIVLVIISFIIYYICDIIIINNYFFGKKLCKAISAAKFNEYYYDKTYPKLTNYKFYIDINNKTYRIVYWVNTNQIGIQEINTNAHIFINSYHTNKVIKILNKRILLNNLSDNGK